MIIRMALMFIYLFNNTKCLSTPNQMFDKNYDEFIFGLLMPLARKFKIFFYDFSS